MSIKKQYKFSIIICFFILFVAGLNSLQAQFKNIKNDVFWNTKDGKPIYSQGGGIFKFNDPVTGKQKYYWYGVHYKGADVYRKDPSKTVETYRFQSVTCYSSNNLVDWTFEGDVFTEEQAFIDTKKTWVGRLGVAYINALDKYAMFVQHGGEVLITVANTPTGPFTWHQKISMKDMIGTTNTGDQTVFTDEDTGISYLIYSYGQGRNKIYVSEIGVKKGKVDLLDCTQIFRGASREGNCMFKYQNKYYMFASNIYGWDSSFAYYLVADDIRGPYLPTNKMLITKGVEEDFSHITQTGFFVNVKGSEKETVVYCGDRWSDFAGNGLGYNQWCPLSFIGDEPYFNSLNSWDLNNKTGNWKVARDNDFVKNGSFEADRRHIPSPVKPVQTVLTGWVTEVIQGTSISLDKASPVLNYFNTQQDRTVVVGEKSLNISDLVNFKRKISQTISSSPYVSLADGFYTLTAKIKNTQGFQLLEMYALSKEESVNYLVKEENKAWKTITIQHIPVKEGKVEIGFIADGTANANAQIDDVSLVKETDE
ncbi:family 43 glycosylhydrolase [Wenyingzhuangia sp. IMCC45467]